MIYFQKEPKLSIVDAALEVQLCARTPDHPGINEISITVADCAGAAVEHVFERTIGETPGDFVAMVLAETKKLGVRAVKFSDVLAVSAEEERQ
jgi:hypothetical protein